MDLKNIHGQTISWGAIGDDVLKYHLSTAKIMKKRHLDFESREKFLEILNDSIENKELFKRIRKNIIKNDDMEAKIMERKINNKKTPKEKTMKTKRTKKTMETKPKENMTKLMEKRTSIESEIETVKKELVSSTSILEIRKKTLEETKKVVEKAKLALKEAKEEHQKAQRIVHKSSTKIEKLKNQLLDIDQKIDEVKKEKIYLVAPGFNGTIPECGTFVSTVAIDGIESVNIEQVEPEFKIKRDFDDMLNAGYDSAQEYARDILFVSLVTQYIYNDKEYLVLSSSSNMDALLSVHVG